MLTSKVSKNVPLSGKKRSTGVESGSSAMESKPGTSSALVGNYLQQRTGSRGGAAAASKMGQSGLSHQNKQNTHRFLAANDETYGSYSLAG